MKNKKNNKNDNSGGGDGWEQTLNILTMAFKMKRWGGYQNSPLKQESPITDDMLASRREKAPWRFGSSAKRGISDEDMRVILEKELIRKTKKQYRKK